ncbi:HAAS signaling domain-containing protein [Georgenia wangjunii]|uniref:HAAS signaling domain-containing protein n=1 Tax=Georgenia wangjunii TaxID=3117730 RepID=UPI002F262BCE
MNATLGRERVASYLDDVARMLATLEPDDRAEVLAGLREHIEAALAARPRPSGQADVDRVLTELGPPDAVAAAALRDLGHPAPVVTGHGLPTLATPAPAAHAPVLERDWVPRVAAALLVIAVVLVVLVVVGAGGLLTARTVSVGPDGSVDVRSAVVDVSGLVGAGLGALVLSLPFWLGGAVLLLLSPRTGGRERVAGTLLVPACAVVLVAVPAVVATTAGAGPALAVAFVVALGAVVAGTVLTVRAVARGTRTGGAPASDRAAGGRR